MIEETFALKFKNLTSQYTPSKIEICIVEGSKKVLNIS